MSRIFILVFAVLLLPNKEETITWEASYKLTWNDFRGPANQASEAVAVTASGITFGYSLQKSNAKTTNFNVHAFAHFYPDKSWVKLDKADSHILAHEQLHFDITELQVRKLKEKISKVKISPSLEDQLDNLHVEAKMTVANMQNQYDSESDYSRNRDAQAEWQIFVEKELEKLVKFKS
jgi:hypothetical protein